MKTKLIRDSSDRRDQRRQTESHVNEVLVATPRPGSASRGLRLTSRQTINASAPSTTAYTLMHQLQDCMRTPYGVKNHSRSRSYSQRSPRRFESEKMIVTKIVSHSHARQST